MLEIDNPRVRPGQAAHIQKGWEHMRRSAVFFTAGLLALLATPGLAATAAPGASTGAATEVTATTATLNGVVNPNKEDTTYVFEYGLTTAYGTTTAPQTEVSGNAG